ncbi:MAG: ABC transporter permease subunit [Bacilli bacterium]|nr:ABC transporter permease subunit [Bacilli bacterium]
MTKSKQLNILFTFLGILTILVVWMVASLIIKQDVILPSIGITLKKLINILGSAYSYKVLGITCLRLAICLLSSLFIAIVLASLSTRFIRFSYYIRPLITLLRTIPVVAIIIVLLVFIGNQKASIFITSLVMLPIMYEGILSGMKNINSDILDEIKIQSNINLYIIRNVFIPLIRPHIIVAIITSLGLGIKVLVMSEFIATPKYSIAKEMFNYQSALQLEGIFAWTIIIVTVIMLLELVIKKINDKYIV